MSEIDELGSSLLNRQRANVDRTDKRLRRNVRNQAALALASKGVQLVNSALKNRADTFVNQNEDLIGQRVLYKSALGDRQAILDDYAAGQAYTGGMEEYLTSKFLTDTTQAITLNVDDKLYTADSIEKLALEKAREAAKAYQPQFETAYKAALNMPELDDYDAFVATQTRGKKATNVGNFLVNSVLRNINEQTPEDTDKQIVDAVLNSRFGENAKAVKAAKSAMDQGYSLKKSQRLASDVKDQLEKETAKIKSVKEIERTISAFGDDRNVILLQTLTEAPDGAIIESTTANYDIDPKTGEYKKDSEGNKILSPQAAKDYLYYKAYQTGRSFPNDINLSDSQIQSFNQSIEFTQENPKEVKVGPYQRDALRVDITGRNFFGDVVSISKGEVVFTEDLTLTQQRERIPDTAVEKAAGEVNNYFSNLVTDVTMFGGKTSGLTKEVLAVAMGNNIDTVEDLIENNRDEVLDTMIKPLYQEAAVSSENLSKELNIDIDLSYKLQSGALGESVVSGMDDAFENYLEDNKFLSVDKFNNSLMLLADARIQEERPGAALEIPETAYNTMVYNAINEIKPLSGSDINAANKKEARQKLKNSFMASDSTVNLAYKPEIIDQLALTHNTSEIISETGEVRVFHILEHFDRLEEQEGITPPPSEDLRPILPEDFKGQATRPEPINVVAPVIDAVKSGEARSKKYRDAIVAYTAEGRRQDLTGPEASRYAKAMVDSMGENITLPK